MVVRKVGGQNLSKKKNVEEAKKMAEKKKMMMKEESEDEDMSDDDEMDDEDLSEETAEESDDMEDSEEEDSDDEESMDEEEGTKKSNKSKDFGQGFIDKRGASKTPAKTPAKTPTKAANKTPAKTPNKSVLQQNSQKKQMESKTPKISKQQNISKLELSPSPKKTDNLKTPASAKQQKASGSTKKKTIEVDEDDDDDDDDDDEEEEEEDDDDDDEEEEEEDEEDEEEEEEEDEKKQAQDDNEEEEEEEDEQPQAKKPKTDFPTVDLKNSEQQRRNERDCRSLYVRGFPTGTTEEEIKALSPDIIAVRIPIKKRKVHNTTGIIFAFLEFASEKAAEENFSVIEKKKFKGKDLFVDFVGEKSKNKSLADKSASQSQKNVNKQKLFVSGIPKQATMEDIGKAFPAAINVFVNNWGVNKTAQILFANEEDAAEAFKSNSSLKMRGNPVVVLYALQGKRNKGGRGKYSPRKSFNQGQGFKKPFQNQRRSFKQQNFDDDE